MSRIGAWSLPRRAGVVSAAVRAHDHTPRRRIRRDGPRARRGGLRSPPFAPSCPTTSTPSPISTGQPSAVRHGGRAGGCGPSQRLLRSRPLARCRPQRPGRRARPALAGGAARRGGRGPVAVPRPRAGCRCADAPGKRLRNAAHARRPRRLPQARGEEAGIAVLGSPEFYGRFGFADAAEFGISGPWPAPGRRLPGLAASTDGASLPSGTPRLSGALQQPLVVPAPRPGAVPTATTRTGVVGLAGLGRLGPRHLALRRMRVRSAADGAGRRTRPMPTA